MKAWKCCKVNMLQWRIQPKFILVLAYMLICTWRYVSPFREFAVVMGIDMAPWIISGLVRAGDWYLYFMLGYLMLICDAPFLNRQQQFVLQRTGKVTWMWGQILYLVVFSALVTLMTWLLTVLVIFPHVDWTSQWGVALQSISRYPGNYPVQPSFAINLYILKNMTGMGATLWALFMQFMIGMFLGVLVMVCNLWGKRGLGVSISAILLSLSQLVKLHVSTAGKIKKLVFLSPLSWMDLTMTGDTSIGQPSLWYCGGVLLVLTVALSTFALCNIHKHSLELNKE